ncbi:MAG: class I SAM-dependent methyltransferase [Nanoarchaeota archaeon]
MEMHRIEKFFVNSPIFNYFHNKFLVSKFLKSIQDNPKNILEIGCGIGYTTKSLSEKFPNARIIAIDYDEEQIKTANRLHENIKNVKFMQGDATNLKFKNNSFDAVFEFNTLHHIKNYKKAINEIKMALKKNKNFYIIDVSKYFFIPIFRSLFPAEAYFTKEGMIKKLAKNNFKIKSHSGKGIFYIVATKK